MSIVHGDCIEVMAGMDGECIDAVVCDPPYGLEFMGKEWDRLWDKRDDGHKGRRNGQGGMATWPTRPTYVAGSAAQAWHQQWAEAAYRVAKPSAYLLAFGGTRTVHRMTVALEDAGWIIRDMLVWAYASGFPKSKASLKPAWEPIVMARKPGPVRMLDIDGCRIQYTTEETAGRDAEQSAGKGWWPVNEAGLRGVETPPAARTGGRVNFDAVQRQHADSAVYVGGAKPGDEIQMFKPEGRWPANVILTDPIFDGGVEGVVGGGEASPGTAAGVRGSSGFANGYDGEYTVPYGDSGTYSRFFLIPKADRADREPVLGGLPTSVDARMGLTHGGPGEPGKGSKEGYEYNPKARANVHPTVKPVDLMRHLVRLVTPAGGTVLDPFLGSGTTAIAAEMEGFPWIGIEREAEYVAIAEARLNGTQKGLGLSFSA